MIEVRAATPDDLDEIVALNAASVPAVGEADADRMAWLIELSALAWVVDGTGSGELAAFVLLFEPGSTYDSKNYRWFCDRFDRFLYVDRVVVAADRRGEGLGAELYDAVAAEALRRGAERVTAEVNLVPPNPGSSRFHRRQGFVLVGEQHHGDDYAVELLAREV